MSRSAGFGQGRPCSGSTWPGGAVTFHTDAAVPAWVCICCQALTRVGYLQGLRWACTSIPASALGLRRRHARGTLSGAGASPTLRRAPWPQVGQRTTCRAQPQRGQPQQRTRAADCGMRSKCGPRCAWTHAAQRACRAAGGQYTHRAARARQWRRASRPTMARSTAQRALSRAVAVARNAQQRQSATGAGAPRQLR